MERSRFLASLISPVFVISSLAMIANRGIMSTMADQAISTARTGASRAGSVAQTGAQAISDVTATFAEKASSSEEDADEAGSEADGIHDEPRESGRHQNGVESRQDQRRPGQPRRK